MEEFRKVYYGGGGGDGLSDEDFHVTKVIASYLFLSDMDASDLDVDHTMRSMIVGGGSGGGSGSSSRKASVFSSSNWVDYNNNK